MELTLRSDKKIRNGQVCFPKTRIPVAYILVHFTKGYNMKDMASLFPEILRKDLMFLKQLKKDLNNYQFCEGATK